MYIVDVRLRRLVLGTHPRAGLLLTPDWARGSLHAGPLVGLRYPTGRCLLLCGLESMQNRGV